MNVKQAVVFLQGFDKPTLLRWFVDLISWRWPEDLPFFPNPLAGRDPVANVADQLDVVTDRTWSSMFIALHHLTTRDERIGALAERETLDRIYSILVGVDIEGMTIGLVTERRA